MLIFEIEEKKHEYKITIEKFHILIPKDLQYSKEDLWVKLQNDEVLLGITDFFQLNLGDIMFVEFEKSSGDPIERGGEFGSIESIKSVLDLIAPCSGTIIEINPVFEKKPELLNQDPYGAAWVCKIHPTNLTEEMNDLLNAATYVQLIKNKYEAHKQREAQQHAA
ncbi:MAG: glycine cleavage system protein GcvH [Candidatus Helarchaeota archaeon]